jgi:hypothetical protein
MDNTSKRLVFVMLALLTLAGIASVSYFFLNLCSLAFPRESPQPTSAPPSKGPLPLSAPPSKGPLPLSAPPSKDLPLSAPPSKDPLPEDPTESVDRVLAKLELGNVAFNSPTTLRLGEVRVIQVLLSKQKSMEDLKGMIAAEGEKKGARIRLSNQMQAKLSGSNFKITPIGSETQAISGTEVTEWNWEVIPTEAGDQRLHLTLSVVLSVEGERTPRTLQSIERTIDVSVTWSQWLSASVATNWQWLWTTLLIPMWAWFVGRGKREKEPVRKTGRSKGQSQRYWQSRGKRKKEPVRKTGFIRFKCSSCGKSLKAHPYSAGMRCACSCGARLIVPDAPGGVA